MATNGIVRFLLTGDTRAFRNALRGSVDEAQRADRQTTASARAADTSRSRSAQNTARNTEQAERQRGQTAQQTDREIERSARRRAREESRLAAQQQREARAALRERRQMMQSVVAGAAGAGAALLGRASGYQSTIGIPGRDSMISSYLTNQQQLIRLAGATHGRVTAESLQERVSSVSQATNVDPAQLIRALDVAQNRFSNLEGFANNLEQIARAAQVGGGDIADYVGVLGEFQRQMGTTSSDTDQMLGSLIQMMDEGSIEAGDFAANFGPMMGTFVNLRGGAGGVTQAREFMAVSEALGAGGVGGDVARTQLGEVMSLMHRRDARGNIERVIGRDVFDEHGTMQISMGEMVRRMAEHREQFTTSAGLGQIFGHGRTQRVPEEAVRALTTLVNLDVARLDNREGRSATIQELEAGSSVTGQERIDSTIEAMMNSTSGQAIGESMRAQAQFAQNGEGVVRMMTAIGGQMADWQTRFPLLTEGFDALRDAAMGAGLSLGALALMNGGAGAVGTAAGAASLAGGGSVGLAGTVLGSALAAPVGAVAAAGAVTLIASTAGGDSGDTAFEGGGALGSRTGSGPARGGGQVGARQAASLSEALSANEGARAAFVMASRDMTQGQRAQFSDATQRGISQGIALTPDTIRSLAAAISRGAPADGREPGEPGRR